MHKFITRDSLPMPPQELIVERIMNKPFQSYLPLGVELRRFMERDKVSVYALSDMIGYSIQTIYLLLNDNKYVENDRIVEQIVSIALAMRLTPDESEYMLEMSGHCLGRKTKRNDVLKFCLERSCFVEECTVVDTNRLLLKIGEKTLLPSYANLLI